MRKIRWLIGMSVPPAVLGGTLLTMLAWRDRLPTELPNRGGVDGRPIVSTITIEGLAGGMLSAPALLWVAGVVAFVLVGRLPAAPAHWLRATIQVAVTAVSAALSTALLVILHAALDARTAAEAGMPSTAAMIGLVPLAFLAGVLVAALLAGRRSPAGRAIGAPGPDATRLPLAGQEKVAWQERRVHRVVDVAVAALALSGAATTAMLVMTAGSPGWAGAVSVIVPVALLPMRSYRLTIDERAVRVTIGPISREVALDSVRRADAVDVDASEWLLKGVLHGARAGMVLLPGPALALRLADGSDFLISCRDVTTAAGLINSMRDRQAAGPALI
ncbi:hypothetical protein ACFOY2_47950 [Nonomuraea purpurea]|uniref:DUF1648 domain-containing protein n=1 Tax=Nonomuraea purpurea TaxID=1849276 RepID=A0ABV8GM65_9ACTN